eukprot:m.263302 g.263302  ORF g.263302 m.263302 type:complete len:358 (+) comp49763_c0_seq1:168-1241(+)
MATSPFGGKHIDYDEEFLVPLTEEELEEAASKLRITYKLKGLLHVQLDDGEFPSEYECIDAISYLHKPWHGPSMSDGSLRHGLPEDCAVQFADVPRGEEKEKTGRLSLVIARKYAISLKNVVASVEHGSNFAFLLRNTGSNPLQMPGHGYICYVFDAGNDEDSKNFITELKRLVTHQAIERATARHSDDGTLSQAIFSHNFDDPLYGDEKRLVEPMVPPLNSHLWYKGPLSRQEADDLHSGKGLDTEVERGDFYIFNRDSSSGNQYVLTVIVDPTNASVAHFLIHITDDGMCYLDGKEKAKFKTFRALIQAYDNKGLGKAFGKKVKLIKALGSKDKNPTLTEKLRKMNLLIQRGIDF